MTSAEKKSEVLERNIVHILQVIQEYSWLLDSFVLDFYTDDHWNKLPLKWQDILDDTGPEELSSLLDYRKQKISLRRVWPLSFLALRAACHQLSICREQVVHNESVVDNNILLESRKLLLDPKFHHVFSKHVKPKKQHEIALMAKVTAESALKAGVCCVVDVGSGLGHLSRTLAYGYGLRVCCLEAQDVLAEQARKLDLELETTIGKYLSAEILSSFQRPIHLNITIGSSENLHVFVQALKNAFQSTDAEDFKFGIVGLHPCGDLGPFLVQLLVKCPSARFINIVGCCYMKLTTLSTSASHFRGYPLSNCISKMIHTLSYESREIACHAIENYCERLQSGDISHLKVHGYRATLEWLLVKHWPHLRHSGIRSIRHANNMPFDKYCKAATERLGVVVPDCDLASEETRKMLAQWKKVVTFYSLRLLLAPLVETVLLMDRHIYLQEEGLKGRLQPLFDPQLSPRNHVLIAIKQPHVS